MNQSKIDLEPWKFQKVKIFQFWGQPDQKNRNWLTLVWFMAKEDLTFHQKYQFFMVFYLLIASKLNRRPENFWTVRFFDYSSISSSSTRRAITSRTWWKSSKRMSGPSWSLKWPVRQRPTRSWLSLSRRRTSRSPHSPWVCLWYRLKTLQETLPTSSLSSS